MKKSNKLSFRKKGVILLILFASISSIFAFYFVPAYGTGINYFSVHNGSFKENNNKDSIPFASPVNYATGICPSSVFCTDLDGDTYSDLAVATGEGVSILINNGDGTFQAKVDYQIGPNTDPMSIYCADLDNDQDMDIAVAAYYQIAIWMNNGDGTFADPIYSGDLGNHYYSIFCADLDEDNDIDLAAADAAWNAVFIVINNGDGTFEFNVNNHYDVGAWPRSVFCSDLDGDLDFDIVTANQNSNDISVLINNGNATFESAVNYETGTSPVYVFCADMNEDSDFDIALANWSSDDVSVLENFLQASSILPAEPFSHLLNNYPNPFSQSTVIDYQLSVTCEVILRVYDMHGQEVITLVNENQPTGKHSVVCDGKDNSGNKIKPCVYFYQLKTENYSTVKKLLLIK